MTNVFSVYTANVRVTKKSAPENYESDISNSGDLPAQPELKNKKKVSSVHAHCK